MDKQLNIIIAGKSGVGKSSFLNYLINNDLLQTGDGVPVTKDYFDKVEYFSPQNGVKYCLYDTKGIEPNTCAEYENVLLTEIEKRDVSADIFSWIHTVYYCFAPPRIEDFEIAFIKKLMSKVSVTVLITKRDLIDDEKKLKGLENQIINSLGFDVQIIPVCSVEKVTRRGKSIKSGREEVLKSSFIGLWNKLANCEPARCINNFTKPFDGGTDLQYFLNYPENAFSTGAIDVFNQLKNRLETFDTQDVWSKSKLMCNDVFDFYATVNGFRPKKMLNLETEKYLNDIKKFDVKPLIIKIKDGYSEMYKAYETWQNCKVFDKTEEKNYIEKRADYVKIVREATKEFVYVLENFVKHYRAQLLQYGQDCLRNDSITENELELAETVNDLNVNQKIFYNMLIHSEQATENNLSDYKKYIFKMLANELNISEKQVEKILHIKNKTIN